MSFVPAPGIVTMQAIWLLDNQPVENTYAYQVAGTINLAKLNAMANTYITWAAAHVSAWPTNAQVLKLYLRDMTTESSVTSEFVPTAAVVGTKVGVTLPSNVTFAVKRMTNLAGRKNRGRIYWIGLTDNDRTDDNHIASSRALQFVTNSNTLLAAELADNSATEVVYHRSLGTGTVITGYTYTDLTIDAMRRRLPDHNRHR